ncbi:MAG: hypothetical protein DWQ31_15000 [Planctomycetota bacterium]|nr:MAG: hypothetical protein DWQ31_15000 [Planctomycetota bacterium]REJ96201.1 MAG: hypothetical protein DWQ35_05030 [Planctomycetota bacterium]REK29357.1 MAG: hypothetical protein DWQ42_03770 [Planctomycetota bacterium]REK44177.1 MAG: hypothetical protein DWQ46_10590 [Planctomycetota bacterium]
MNESKTVDRTSECVDSSRRDAAVDSSRLGRQRMLEAMRELEAALANAAPRRESKWKSHVATTLAALEEEMQKQALELRDDDGLFADLLREAPRLDNQINQLRQQHDDLVRQIKSLREELFSNSDDGPPDVGDIRQRLAWLLTSLRHFQSRETDLIYEATQVDIGELD